MMDVVGCGLAWLAAEVGGSIEMRGDGLDRGCHGMGWAAGMDAKRKARGLFMRRGRDVLTRC